MNDLRGSHVLEGKTFLADSVSFDQLLSLIDTLTHTHRERVHIHVHTCACSN